MDNGRILVGDVGGTHARFAIVDTSVQPFQVTAHKELEAKEFDGFSAAFTKYLDELEEEKPCRASIAVAGPVTNGHVHFTNSGWNVTEQELRDRGFARALLINDFAALAFSTAEIRAPSLRTIGPEVDGVPDQPITILGAGTGLGVSCLARYRGRSVPLATEGGHMSFAPRGEKQEAVLRVLTKRFGHVSLERVLSGPGLENIYSALTEMGGTKAEPFPAEQISKSAELGDADARAAQDMFCAIYGAAAGDFALAHGARGGVYIAGGIAAKIEAYLQRSQFRAAFEDKGRLSEYVKAIPTRLILDENAAFLGAARASLEFSEERD